jgi:hypothetical protein
MSQRFLRSCGVALLVPVVLLAAAPLVQATMVADDFDFSSWPVNHDYLYDVVPAGGTGWQSNGATPAGDWGATTTGEMTAQPQIDNSANLSSPLYSRAQTGTGYAYVCQPNNNYRGLNRFVATPLSGTVWFSFLENPTTDTVHQAFAGVELNAHGGPPFAGQDYVRGSYEVGINKDTLQLYWNGTDIPGTAGAMTPGVTHWIIGKLLIGSGNDSIQVWADPASIASEAAMGSPLLSASGADMGSALTLIGLGANQVGGPGSSALPCASFDSLLFSDGVNGFHDVTGGYSPVPEPGTLLLLGYVLLGLLAYAWRKRK